MTLFEILDVGLKMLTAVLLGAVLGWEREWRNKPAGLKTHALVSVEAGKSLSACRVGLPSVSLSTFSGFPLGQRLC